MIFTVYWVTALLLGSVCLIMAVIYGACALVDQDEDAARRSLKWAACIPLMWAWPLALPVALVMAVVGIYDIGYGEGSNRPQKRVVDSAEWD